MQDDHTFPVTASALTGAPGFVATHHSFRSRYHPDLDGGTGAASATLARTLAAVLTPVCILMLFAALQGYDLWSLLLIVSPAAIIVSLGWTAFDLKLRMAELFVKPGLASTRSVFGILTHRERLEWKPVVDLRRAANSLYVGLGDGSIELHDEDWPEMLQIMEALRASRDSAELDIRFPS